MRVIKTDNPPIEDINDANVSTFDPRYGIFSDTDNHISKILSINSNENTSDKFSLDDTENILNSTTLHTEYTSDHSTLLNESGFLDETPRLCENHDISIEKILASTSNDDEGLNQLKNIRKKYLSNPLIGYLNINSLRAINFFFLKILFQIAP